MKVIPSFVTRTETKVLATAAGGGAGAIISGLVIWAMGVLFWHASSSATGEQAAIAAVPTVVTAAVAFVITVGLAWFGGYQAPPSNNAGNNLTGAVMDDSTAGHVGLTRADDLDDDDPATTSGPSLPDDV